MLKVQNMVSTASGREVANQFIIEEGNKVMFQSYDSPIIEIDRDSMIITVFPHYDYSRTTSKYRNQFMQSQGLRGMADKKGFENHMNAGRIGDFEIVKAF